MCGSDRGKRVFRRGGGLRRVVFLPQGGFFFYFLAFLLDFLDFSLGSVQMTGGLVLHRRQWIRLGL